MIRQAFKLRNISFQSLRLPSAIQTKSLLPILSSFKTFSTEQTIDMPEAELTARNTERMGFKTETRKLLDIVTHSLYTDKEVFIRELLSNASDALEKQRMLEVGGQVSMIGEPLYISITTNDKNKTITIFDSGVGMSREEMVDNLGTIAKSGTQAFLKEAQGKNSDTTSLIGQFGVGFYSSFIVGETIDVISKKQENEQAHLWSSDGSGEFSISDLENVDFIRGTKIIIHLKPECRDFSKGSEIQKIIKKYSGYISYTIKLNGEVANTLQAIWYREKSEVSMEEYQTYFETLNNGSKYPFKYHVHFATDVPLDIKTVLFIPSHNSEKMGASEENKGLNLYSKKVLIKPNCSELTPNYLRFLKGVVDCADIPLSISRESYQDSSLIFKLKALIIRRVIKKLEDELKANPTVYDQWYDEFNQFLKEGLMTDHDNAEPLFRLQRFKSSFSPVKRIGIEDYVKKMLPGQDKIYFLCSTDTDLSNNIYLETYKGTDLPILVSNNPIDEMIFKNSQSYKSFRFLNVENESDDFLSKYKQDTDSSAVNELIPGDDMTSYTMWLKNELEPFVSKVVLSKRLRDSPILITSGMSSNMKAMYAMMSQENDPYAATKDLTLEINQFHPVIVELNNLRKTEPKMATLIAKQLLDTGLLQANLPLPNKDFVKRNFNILAQFLSVRKPNEQVLVGETTEEALKQAKKSNKSQFEALDDKKV